MRLFTTSTAVVLGALSFSASARGECVSMVTAAELGQSISAADTSYDDMEEELFREHRQAASWAIPCLSEQISSGVATGFYRVDALGAFLDRNHGAAVGSLMALTDVSPGYVLSDEVAPEGHPMRLYFDIAEGMVSVPTAQLPVPASGLLVIDGVAATSAPVDRPYIFQHIAEDGVVLQSALVQPGIGPPSFDVLVAPAVVPDKLVQQVAIGSGGAAVLSAVFYVLATTSENKFWNPDTPMDDLLTIRKRANRYGTLAFSTGLLALGGAGGAYYLAEW